MSRAHPMDVPYRVTVPVTITVSTTSKEEAEALATDFLLIDLNAYDPEVDTTKMKSRKQWKEIAEQLLSDGASYREVAASIGVDHASIHKALPGRGWTKQEGVEFRAAKRAAGL